MNGATTKRIKEECKRFIRIKGIPETKYPLLLDLALRSYMSLSAKEKGKWSLEQIIKQGL